MEAGIESVKAKEKELEIKIRELTEQNKTHTSIEDVCNHSIREQILKVKEAEIDEKDKQIRELKIKLSESSNRPAIEIESIIKANEEYKRLLLKADVFA